MSDMPRIFFTHVMKSGGTSIGRRLARHYPLEQRYPGEDTFGGKLFIDRLLELEPGDRDRVRLFSVHQPAWVGAHVAPDALSITVLREPVARTISHLRHIAAIEQHPDNLDEIYADERWRSRLRDYQTFVFSDTLARHQQAAAEAAANVARMTDADDAALFDATQVFFATAIVAPRVLDAADLDAAIATLDRLDLVGTTEDLDTFSAALADRCGRSLGSPPHANQTKAQEQEPSEELLGRIRDDTRLDAELYAHAVRRLRP